MGDLIHAGVYCIASHHITFIQSRSTPCRIFNTYLFRVPVAEEYSQMQIQGYEKYSENVHLKIAHNVYQMFFLNVL